MKEQIGHFSALGLKDKFKILFFEYPLNRLNGTLEISTKSKNRC